MTVTLRVGALGPCIDSQKRATGSPRVGAANVKVMQTWVYQKVHMLKPTVPHPPSNLQMFF